MLTREVPGGIGLPLTKPYVNTMCVGGATSTISPVTSSAPRAVEAVFVVAAALDETGFAERAQLQRHGAEGDVGHRGMNVPGGQLAAPYEPQDLAPAWRRDGGKDGRGMLHVCEFRSN